MSYDVYQQARDVAWKFLINNHVTSLPVKLSAICKQRNISLCELTRKTSKMGKAE